MFFAVSCNNPRGFLFVELLWMVNEPLQRSKKSAELDV